MTPKDLSWYMKHGWEPGDSDAWGALMQGHANDSIQRRFREFHRDNPAVYLMLEKLIVDKLERRPSSRFGIKHVWEVMRWTLDMDVDSGEEFKLSNDFTSRYARLLLLYHPEWRFRMEVRSLR